MSGRARRRRGRPGLGIRRLLGHGALALLGDEGGERLPLDELHGIEMDAAFLTDAINRHDVGMVQSGGGPRLVMESLQMTRVHRRRERQHLQRHPTTQRHLFRLIDNAHAAAAYFTEDAEIAKPILDGIHGIRKDSSAFARGTTEISHRLQSRHQPAQLRGVLIVCLQIGRPIHHFPCQALACQFFEQGSKGRVGRTVDGIHGCRNGHGSFSSRRSPRWSRRRPKARA